jgi:hypothetical protein
MIERIDVTRVRFSKDKKGNLRLCYGDHDEGCIWHKMTQAEVLELLEELRVIASRDKFAQEKTKKLLISR